MRDCRRVFRTAALAASIMLGLASPAHAASTADTAVRAFKAICLDEFTGMDINATVRLAQGSEYGFHFSKEDYIDTNDETFKILDNGDLILWIEYNPEFEHKTCNITFKSNIKDDAYVAAIDNQINGIVKFSDYDKLDKDRRSGLKIATGRISNQKLWQMAGNPDSNRLLPHFIVFGNNDARPGERMLSAVYDYY